MTMELARAAGAETEKPPEPEPVPDVDQPPPLALEIGGGVVGQPLVGRQPVLVEPRLPPFQSTVSSSDGRSGNRRISPTDRGRSSVRAVRPASGWARPSGPGCGLEWSRRMQGRGRDPAMGLETDRPAHQGPEHAHLTPAGQVAGGGSISPPGPAPRAPPSR